MDSKIFLGKYRVAPEEIEAVGGPADSVLAYEAEEIDSGKKVVVEMVPAGSLKIAVRERLEAEAIAAKKLSHVNIPALYDFGVENDHLVYVTEDFEGTLAEEWVNARGPMPVGPVLRIASQVMSALGAAAFHRINHHAINPSNLVLAPGQTAEGDWPLVKVLHFVGGAPKFAGTDVAVAALDKSLHYASPEQIQKGTVDFRSEIYSLGCTMWFLLTGAPQLTAPKGPASVQPGQTGPAEENLSAVPKKIRHLLAQMLSENPEARPRDPLAFHRKLQDCLAQVEPRETAASKSRAPSFSPTVADRTPRPRRNPLKALARAAIFLVLAALAALVLRGYLQHRRVVRTEEPIGVPIGVADASATPANLSTANVIASNTLPSTTVAPDLAKTEPAPAKSVESDKGNAQTPGANSVESASTTQVAVAPTAPFPSTPQAQEPASIAANNVSTLSATIDSSEVAVAAQVELVPATAQSRSVETDAVASQTTPRKIIMREVRRAELVEEPEVRRAELAPPEGGPVDVVPARSLSATQPSKSVTRAEKSRDEKRTDSEPTLPATPDEKKWEPTPRPKLQANGIIYLPRPAR